ncbi:MAG: pilus assembly protein N-terminal domain-containing protein [Candidatus Omnitrophica bacterium]|nr:pilus assembly protein N-terminal domain-containing protein [Candidatus Omnitrophota bacterium]
MPGRLPGGGRLLLPALCLWFFCAPAAAQADGRPVPQSSITELAVGQSLSFAIPDIRRVLVGDPAVVTASQPAPGRLRLQGLSPGRTFIHIWTPAGRISRIVRVRVARIALSPRERAIERAITHAQPLVLGYDVSYEVFRRGPRLSETGLDTVTRMYHTVTGRMETPLGNSSSLVGFQRVNSTQDLTTWWTQLTDGHVGPLRDFDVIGGDAQVPFGFGSFSAPSAGFRGAELTYRGVEDWRATGLWGRERLGVFATPLGVTAEPNAYLYGFQLGYEPSAGPWTVRWSSLFGYGQDRAATQSDYVLDLVNTVRLAEPWSLQSEASLSEGKLAYTIGSSWQMPHHRLRLRFRDVDEEFMTVVGSGPDRGERGLSVGGTLAPARWLTLDAAADVFRNRLFPNPAEPDRLNLDAGGGVSLLPWPGTTLSAFTNRERHPGLLSPSDDLRFGSAISQRLGLGWLIPFARTALVSGRYERQDSRNAAAPVLDYNADVFSTNLSVPLALGLTASVGEQWRLVEETLTGRRSRPRRFATSVSHLSSYRQGRWQLRGRFGYEDEEQAGSLRSFLAGQDRLVWEAGIRHRPSASSDMFADGRLERVRFQATGQERVEFSFFTGARLLFDTRVIRWDPSGPVSGTVYHDTNGDGTRQSGEEGLQGVKVVASAARQAVTDARGRFRFGRLWGKSIPISVDVSTLPRGYVVSTPHTRLIDPSLRRERVVEFGALGRSEVRGRVFDDVDGDGRFSAPDRGLEGVQVQLDGRSARTDQGGIYAFRDLPGGAYTLALVLPSLPVRYLPSVPLRQSLRVEEGESVTSDIPVAVRRLLTGRVFIDRNRNHAFDPGEPPLPGVSMCLDGKRLAQSDAQGRYQFADLSAGRHALDLNCGMPMHDLLPLSPMRPVIRVGPDAPERITVDFQLERRDEDESTNDQIPITK